MYIKRAKNSFPTYVLFIFIFKIEQHPKCKWINQPIIIVKL